MKTIFVSIISGVEAKNLLRTNVISALVAREDIRVVLFVRSHERIAFYEKEFSHSRLAYEVAPDAESGRMWRYFERLRHYLVNTRSQKLYKTLAYQDRRNLIAYIASNLASATLAHRSIRRLVRALEMALVRDDPFAPYFEKYKPDRVFLANLFDGTEVDLLRVAKRRGISSVGFINSWDCRSMICMRLATGSCRARYFSKGSGLILQRSWSSLLPQDQATGLRTVIS